MDLFKFVIGWFYYSFFYMFFSVIATLILNRVTKRLWLTPLIINAVSVLMLIVLITNHMMNPAEISYAMYFNYLPIVFASIVVNVIIGITRKLKKIRFEV